MSSLYTTCTANILITLVPPFSIPSLSSDIGLSPYLWSSPSPSMLRTSDIEFDVVGINSTYLHLALWKRQQDKQTNVWSGKFSKVDSTFLESQVNHVSKCPERSFEISFCRQFVQSFPVILRSEVYVWWKCKKQPIKLPQNKDISTSFYWK